MKRQLLCLCRYVLICIPITTIADSKWTLDEKVDPLTDERVAIAHSSYTVDSFKRTATIRCVDKKFDVYFGFGEVLGESMVPIRYRIDKKPLVEQEWRAGANRKDIYVISPYKFAWSLSRGSTLIIEAKDFNGERHRATFDLTGAQDALNAVIDQCLFLSMRTTAKAKQELDSVQRSRKEAERQEKITKLGGDDRSGVRRLLLQAKTQIEDDRLSHPPGRNALESFRGVLELDSENEQAKAGLIEVADRYLNLASTNMRENKTNNALLYI